MLGYICDVLKQALEFYQIYYRPTVVLWQLYEILMHNKQSCPYRSNRNSNIISQCLNNLCLNLNISFLLVCYFPIVCVCVTQNKTFDIRNLYRVREIHGQFPGPINEKTGEVVTYIYLQQQSTDHGPISSRHTGDQELIRSFSLGVALDFFSS